MTSPLLLSGYRVIVYRCNNSSEHSKKENERWAKQCRKEYIGKQRRFPIKNTNSRNHEVKVKTTIFLYYVQPGPAKILPRQKSWLNADLAEIRVNAECWAFVSSNYFNLPATYSARGRMNVVWHLLTYHISNWELTINYCTFNVFVVIETFQRMFCAHTEPDSGRASTQRRPCSKLC